MSFLLSSLKYFALFAVGGLLALAFAPFKFSLLAFVTPGFLALMLFSETPRESFIRAWFFGFGFFTAGVSWVYFSMNEFGHLPVLLSLALTFIFCGFLALYFGCQGFVLSVWNKTGLIKISEYRREIQFYLIDFPMIWVIFEWLRSYLFTGFPWLLIGYSQINSLLSGYIPVVGQYGCAFILLTLNGMLALILQIYIFDYDKLTRFTIWRKTTLRGYSNNIKLFFALICFALVFLLGGYLFGLIQWSKPIGKSLTVALVQGNIPQDEKWQADNIVPTIKIYTNATQNYWGTDLIVWPEGAITIPLNQIKDFTHLVDRKAKTHQSTVIFGGLVSADEDALFYNALMMLGTYQGHYYKRHLVPFGEYVPFNFIFGKIFAFFNLPYGGIAEGEMQQPLLQVQGIKIAPFICYEIVVSELLKQSLPNANALLVISNDAWFGHSFASAQHLEAAQFRALESGRPLISTTNTGITALVDHHGNILKQIPLFTRQTLLGSIQPMKGKTPWTILGDVGVMFGLLLLFGLLSVCSIFDKKN